jgi:uncharacterized protein YjbI with pentapeptide repeats
MSGFTLKRWNGVVIANGSDARDVAQANAASLQEANLPGANLQEANLWKANLRKANLREADLQEADLPGANLREADLWEANLQEADLQEANLWEANLQGANLQGANLQGANLQGANLKGASIIPTIFDRRGFAFYVTWQLKDPSPEPIIRAGCRTWEAFADAKSHYGENYDRDGDPVECLAIIEFMEARFNARIAEDEV